jgi:hypothetical protein
MLMAASFSARFQCQLYFAFEFISTLLSQPQVLIARGKTLPKARAGEAPASRSHDQPLLHALANKSDGNAQASNLSSRL